MQGAFLPTLCGFQKSLEKILVAIKLSESASAKSEKVVCWSFEVILLVSWTRRFFASEGKVFFVSLEISLLGCFRFVRVLVRKLIVI